MCCVCRVKKGEPRAEGRKGGRYLGQVVIVAGSASKLLHGRDHDLVLARPASAVLGLQHAKASSHVLPAFVLSTLHTAHAAYDACHEMRWIPERREGVVDVVVEDARASAPPLGRPDGDICSGRTSGEWCEPGVR